MGPKGSVSKDVAVWVRGMRMSHKQCHCSTKSERWSWREGLGRSRKLGFLLWRCWAPAEGVKRGLCVARSAVEQDRAAFPAPSVHPTWVRVPGLPVTKQTPSNQFLFSKSQLSYLKNLANSVYSLLLHSLLPLLHTVSQSITEFNRSLDWCPL